MFLWQYSTPDIICKKSQIKKEIIEPSSMNQINTNYQFDKHGHDRSMKVNRYKKNTSAHGTAYANHTAAQTREYNASCNMNK